MDFVRRCYVHDRRLFRGRPELLTRGRYYRAPDDAPAFPGDHLFGSYNWIAGNDLEDPELGEVFDQERPFYDGAPPPRLPSPTICGPREWFTAGDPGGPQVGLDSCLDIPYPTAITFRARITDTVSPYQGWEGTEATFTRENTPQESWVATFVAPIGGALLSINFLCQDVVDPPAGVYYAATITFPTVEFLAENEADSWRDPLRLIFDNSSKFTLTVGDLPAAGGATVWGILPCCFLDPIPRRPVQWEDFDFTNTAVLYMLATIEAATYEATPANAVAILSAWLGAPTATAWVANGPDIPPGSVIAVYPAFTLVFFSGTTSELQLALQVLGSVDGPQDQGDYSTQTVWRLTGRAIHDRILALGLDPETPVLLVGHSMGGASAATLAADYYLAQPGRQVSLLTFGSPKAGDLRMGRIVGRLRNLRVEAFGDPVPECPPDLQWISVVASFFDMAVLLNWSKFRPCGSGQQLQEDGTLEHTAVSPAFTTDMVKIMLNFFVIIIGLDFAAHDMTGYCTRLNAGVAPGTDGYPVSAAALAVARGLYP